MKIILQKDVKDLGKVGDVLNVKPGYARNFLFPRKLAENATEGNVKEWEHQKRVAEIKKKKAQGERAELLKKVQSVVTTFKVAASENEKIFGSITTNDISKELEKHGFSVDRRDIVLEDQIKALGTYKAIIKFGEGAEAAFQVVVERAT